MANHDKAVGAEAEALIPHFKLEKVLNQDQAGRRIVLLGSIHSKPGLLILERAPFASSTDILSSLPSSLSSLSNLGANDVYFWYLASSPAPHAGTPPAEDLKINLIYPCTDAHIKKYSRQGARVVVETPAIYREHVRPYMQSKREQGRLNWVWNIIDGKTEVEDVIYRTELGVDVYRGFLLLPDLNWDRKTMDSLHLLGLVERKDIWSLRDLQKGHVGWLREMRAKFIEATTKMYPNIEEDQLKLYVHYQPTYYHFHVHIVHLAQEAAATQAVGKAIGLDSIIEQLESMAGAQDAGMDSVCLTYTVGEASELWTDVYEPMKKNRASRSQ